MKELQFCLELTQHTEAAAQRCSKERCSKNLQQIYRRTPMPKCNFNKIALLCKLNFGMAVNLLHIFGTPFPKNTSERLLLNALLLIFNIPRKQGSSRLLECSSGERHRNLEQSITNFDDFSTIFRAHGQCKNSQVTSQESVL